ncbi:glycoside hydrolase superfamily, partial [Mycena olivaceomarginata]
RKCGIRVNLDLYTAPGSQNGEWCGVINFLLDCVMGYTSGRCMLDYIRVIIEFSSQHEHKDMIPMFGIVNGGACPLQPRDSNRPSLQQPPGIGYDVLTSFFLQTHNIIRGITGNGAGNGPFISIYDDFQGITSWAGFLDTHPYFGYDGAPNDSPIATSRDPLEAAEYETDADFRPSFESSLSAFGVMVAGDFSNGYSDCELYLTGFDGTQHYGEDCSQWPDASTWNEHASGSSPSRRWT